MSDLEQQTSAENLSATCYNLGLFAGTNIYSLEKKELSTLLGIVNKNRDTLLDAIGKLLKGNDEEKQNANIYIRIEEPARGLPQRIQARIDELNK